VVTSRLPFVGHVSKQHYTGCCKTAVDRVLQNSTIQVLQNSTIQGVAKYLTGTGAADRELWCRESLTLGVCVTWQRLHEPVPTLRLIHTLVTIATGIHYAAPPLQHATVDSSAALIERTWGGGIYDVISSSKNSCLNCEVLIWVVCALVLVRGRLRLGAGPDLFSTAPVGYVRNFAVMVNSSKAPTYV
jgi:hypothetical protein